MLRTVWPPLLALAGCALAATVAGCDNTIFPAPITASTGAALTSDYAGMQGIFSANCYSCHGTTPALGGLDLQTDACAALVDASSTSYSPALRIVPGDHASSVLWNKINGTDVDGQRMPQGGQLDDATITAVETWIDSGAPCTSGDTGSDTDTQSDTGGGDTGGDSGGGDLYAFAQVQNIFDAHCISCHSVDGYRPPNATPPMYLTDGDSYAAIVGQPSTKSSDERVKPYDPEHSFLWRKVDHQLHTGEGAVMPFDGDQLKPDELGVIYGWIARGANAQ